MDMHRLSPEQIKIDQALPWDVYDINGQLLLRKGYVVEKNSQIEMLLDRGMFVDAEQFKASQTVAPKFNPFWLWDDVQRKLARFLKTIDTQEDFADQIEGLAALLQYLSDKDADAGIATIQLIDNSKYPIAHALHVAVICELVGKKLDWPITKRLSLICSALTMNVAMLDLQTHLTHQATPLNPEQKAQIQNHPKTGFDMLQKAGVTDPVWLQTVLEHHEEPDGTGYPQKISSICETGQLLHLIDIFCAKISPRVYRKSIPANLAAKELFVEHGQAKQNPFAALIIKEVGIYPPGSFVKLANGETAVVVRRGQNANAPTVFSLVSGTGIPFVDPVFRDTSHKNYEIKAIVPREKIIIRLNVSKIWGY